MAAQSTPIPRARRSGSRSTDRHRDLSKSMCPEKDPSSRAPRLHRPPGSSSRGFSGALLETFRKRPTWRKNQPGWKPGSGREISNPRYRKEITTGQQESVLAPPPAHERVQSENGDEKDKELDAGEEQTGRGPRINGSDVRSKRQDRFRSLDRLGQSRFPKR